MMQSDDAPNSEFQRWLDDSNNGQPTLLQQIKLAKQLYDESVGPERESTTVEQIANDLQQSPLRRPVDELVTWKGVRAEWFVQVFCETPYMRRLRDFGCAVWFVQTVGMVELLRRLIRHNSNGSGDWWQWTSLSRSRHQRAPLAGTLVDHMESFKTLHSPSNSTSLASSSSSLFVATVGPATVYVSTGDGTCTLQYFVDSLSQLDPSEYVWMELACLDSFAGTGKAQSDELRKFRELLVYSIPKQIPSMQKTALVVEWDHLARALQKSWTLWELLSAAEANVAMTVLIPQLQAEQHISNCFEDKAEFEALQHMLASINVSTAARDDDDSAWDRIVNERLSKKGTYSANCRIRAMIRGWFIEMALGRLEKLQASGVMSCEFLTHLAQLLKEQGLLSKAQSVLEEALEASRQQLGEHHSERLAVMSNLALLLQEQGKYAQAEPLCRAALQVQSQQLGGQHPDTLTSTSNLAELLRQQGKLAEAEALQTQVLERRRHELGDEHPSTLESCSHVALLLAARGELSQAETLARKVVAGSLEQRGANHPQTLAAMSNVAMLLRQQDKLADAEALLRTVLDGYRQQLGDTHASTLSSISSLGNLLKEQGKLQEAEPFYREAFAGRQQLLGFDHPVTLMCMNNLAMLLRAQGRSGEAEPLIREALECQLHESADDQQANTFVFMSNLALILQDQGKLSEAELLFKEALNGRRERLGDEHADTLNAMNNLALLYHAQGKEAEAEALFRAALACQRQKLGIHHASTLASVHNLASTLQDEGKLSEAETVYRDALDGCQKHLGTKNPATQSLMNDLASLLEQQGKANKI